MTRLHLSPGQSAPEMGRMYRFEKENGQTCYADTARLQTKCDATLGTDKVP